MINTREFLKFQQLQAASHAVMESFYRHTVMTRVVKLPDQLPIVVKRKDRPCFKYDFVMTQWGVIRLLDDAGFTVDKSPLCYDLDTAVLNQINEETMHAAKL
jgi:hypothetical protein